MHQISTAPAPNNNQWVIPAIMDVKIPLIENQSIDHSGTYRIVQRTVNGQTGLVIEEYIPEPEPQNNTRAMIIDEDENNNENNEENNNDDGQMVLRGQNNVRGLPDSTGTAIEGTFEINIPSSITSKINIKYLYYNNSSLVELSSLSTITSPSIKVNWQSIDVFFEETDTSYNIEVYVNKSGYDISNVTAPVGGKRYESNFNTYGNVDLYDNNNNYIMTVYDNTKSVISTAIATYITLNKTNFNLILD